MFTLIIRLTSLGSFCSCETFIEKRYIYYEKDKGSYRRRWTNLFQKQECNCSLGSTLNWKERKFLVECWNSFEMGYGLEPHWWSHICLEVSINTRCSLQRDHCSRSVQPMHCNACRLEKYERRHKRKLMPLNSWVIIWIFNAGIDIKTTGCHVTAPIRLYKIVIPLGAEIWVKVH